MKPMPPMEPMKPLDFGPDWWPRGLGRPSSSGAQDGARYAFFPETRRLVVERDGKVAIYDSGDHQIGGVSQQQGSSQSLVFTCQNGTVRIAELKQVG